MDLRLRGLGGELSIRLSLAVTVRQVLVPRA